MSLPDIPTPFYPWIKRLVMRSVVSEEELRAVTALPYELRSYEANRDFVRLGELTTHACVIVSGLAGRFDQTATGARQITALHIPGDAADLHTTPLPRASSALQALTRTEVAHIPHVALRELGATYPALAMAFWRDCMVDSSILSKWVLTIGRTSARQRIAHLLCELALRYAVIGNNRGDFPFPATQVHMGDVTGLTNVHINRTIRGLADDGLANVKGGRIEILEWEALVEEADFDPHYLHLPETLVADVTDGAVSTL